jgi:hypothetical protein
MAKEGRHMESLFAVLGALLLLDILALRFGQDSRDFRRSAWW